MFYFFTERRKEVICKHSRYILCKKERFVVSSVLPTKNSRGPPKVRSHFAGYMDKGGDFFAEPDGFLFYADKYRLMQA